MARARNIKPGFFRNADLVELSFEERLLFIGLWTLADRDGRLEDRPKQIKMELFPADSVDCNAMLDSLDATGMVARYEVDGKRYLQVVSFGKHQNPHRDEKSSTIPDQCGNVATIKHEQDKHCASTVQASCETDANTVAIGLNPDPRSLIPDPQTNTQPPADKSADSFPEKQKAELPGFENFWKTWPTNDRKQAKGKCLDAWKKASAERDAALVLAHVSSLKNSAWLKDGGQFVPAPLVYLNQRRWEGAETASESSIGVFL